MEGGHDHDRAHVGAVATATARGAHDLGRDPRVRHRHTPAGRVPRRARSRRCGRTATRTGTDGDVVVVAPARHGPHLVRHRVGRGPRAEHRDDRSQHGRRARRDLGVGADRRGAHPRVQARARPLADHRERRHRRPLDADHRRRLPARPRHGASRRSCCTRDRCGRRRRDLHAPGHRRPRHEASGPAVRIRSGDERELRRHLHRLPRGRLDGPVPRVPRSEVARRVRGVARRVQEPVPRPQRFEALSQLGLGRAPERDGRRRHRRRGRVPEHGAAVLPERELHGACAGDARRLRPPLGRPAGAQPLGARPLRRAGTRTARGDGADPPERRRRRGRDDPLGGRERSARRRAAPGRAARLAPPAAVRERRVRTDLGRVRGDRPSGEPPLGQRRTRLRPLSRRRRHVDPRDRLLRAPRVLGVDLRRRVRAPPEAEVRARGVGHGLDRGRDAAHRLHGEAHLRRQGR